jgi:menaquinone-dependent protoporphyrinogen IX oxidase
MAEVLIVYSPTEEHVAVAAQQLRRVVERRGHEARTCSVVEAPTAPIGYDLVLVGVPVQTGERHDDLVRWVQGNREQLRHRAAAYFEVSLSPGAPSATFADELTARTGWTPDRTWRFADYDDVEIAGQVECRTLDGQVRAGSA